MKNELALPGQTKGRSTRCTPLKLPLFIIALFLLLSPVYAPAEEPLFLGEDAVSKTPARVPKAGMVDITNIFFADIEKMDSGVIMEAG